MNKTIKIGWTTYKMFQNNQTNWVFVYGQTSRTKRNSYPIAQIIDGTIITVDSEEAISGVTNEDLARAWLNS